MTFFVTFFILFTGFHVMSVQGIFVRHGKGNMTGIRLVSGDSQCIRGRIEFYDGKANHDWFTLSTCSPDFGVRFGLHSALQLHFRLQKNVAAVHDQKGNGWIYFVRH